MLINIIKNISVITTINIASIYYYIQYKKKSSEKLNIIFDLDETIIHSDKINNVENYNNSNIINTNQITIQSTNRIVWIRPFVKTLLPIISEFNNLYLFTKATKPYADIVLEKSNLDKYFKLKKYRDECTGTCKDITKFDLPLENSFLIDDKLINKCQGQNFYHIPRFNYYVKNDLEFFKLFGWIIWINIQRDLKKIRK